MLEEYIEHKKEKYPHLCYTAFDNAPRPSEVSVQDHGHYMRVPMKWKNYVMWGFATVEGLERFRLKFVTVAPD